jgi:hypothetical protein
MGRFRGRSRRRVDDRHARAGCTRRTNSTMHQGRNQAMIVDADDRLQRILCMVYEHVSERSEDTAGDRWATRDRDRVGPHARGIAAAMHTVHDSSRVVQHDHVPTG